MAQLVQDDVQVSLLATTGQAGLAVEWLASRFGLSADFAESVLDQGCGLLIARLGRDEARAAMPIMAALGLEVAIQPCEALPPDEFCDVSIRISETKAARKLILTLERLLGLTGLTASSFCGVEGHVIRCLPTARAEWLCRALRKQSGVATAVSGHQTARYDLFAEAELTEQESAAVRHHLRLLGASADGFGDAIGVGLDRRVKERMLGKFADLGLFAANQAFQRHELLIIGKGKLAQQEFVDFLLTRPIAVGVPPGQLLRSLPLTVERFLTRPAARQFLADYTAIGMQAVTRLVRRKDARE